jgi:hypothetical protein
MKFLESLNHIPPYATGDMVKEWTGWVSLIDDPDFSLKIPREDLPAGTTAAYWMDVREYGPVEVMKRALEENKKLRGLVLQGSGDYQTTVEGDFKDWEEGLSDFLAGKNEENNAQEEKNNDATTASGIVQSRLFKGLNHLFMPGEMADGPASYETPAHVDEKVMTTILGWIHKQTPADLEV